METSRAKVNAPAPSGGVLKFFLITYTVTWTCWILMIAIPVPASNPFRQVLLLLGVFAPALVALLLTLRAEGRAGVCQLLQGVVRWQVAGRWYVFAISYTILIKFSAAVVYRLATGSWPSLGADPLYVLPFAILLSTPVQSGEEIGWRGYALPRMAARFGLASASVLLGVAWAAWHLPLFFFREADTYHRSFILFLVQVTALSVAMAWLWQRTGRSLLLTMVMHAAYNNTKDIFTSVTPVGTRTFGLSASLLSWIAAAILCLCAAYFIVQMRRQKLPDLELGAADANLSPPAG
jgi:membrane protease YdiL (CAAX protease family)